MAKSGSVRQAALAKARERRLALDAERDQRDRRVEDAAAEVFVLLGQRAEAEQAVDAANLTIGQALRRVLGESVGVDAAAELVDLDTAEVRRLTRLAVTRSTGAESAGADTPAGDEVDAKPVPSPAPAADAVADRTAGTAGCAVAAG